MGNQEFLLVGVLTFGWLLGSIFIAGLGGGRSGWLAFFGWFLAAMLFSPFLAALGLIVTSIHALEDRLVEELEPLRDSAGGPPTRFQQRFGGLAADKGDDD